MFYFLVYSFNFGTSLTPDTLTRLFIALNFKQRNSVSLDYFGEMRPIPYKLLLVFYKIYFYVMHTT